MINPAEDICKMRRGPNKTKPASSCDLSLVCYTERATNAWNRQGTQKTGNIHNQPKRQSIAQLTDQAPGTIERAAQESSRIPQTSTATAHASSTAASSHHYARRAGSSPHPLTSRQLTQCEAQAD